MVPTVEPGIYVSADDHKAPKALRGQAVRIEDEVVITPHGPQLLTDAVPKTIAEIESMMRVG